MQSDWHQQSLDQSKYSSLVSRWHKTFVDPIAELDPETRRFVVTPNAARDLQAVILTEVFVQVDIGLPPQCRFTVIPEEADDEQERTQTLGMPPADDIDARLKRELPQDLQAAFETISADRHLGDVKALLVQDVIPTLRRLSLDGNQGAVDDYLVRRVLDISPPNELWVPRDAQVQHLYHIYEFLFDRQSKPFEDAFPANLSTNLCQPLSEPHNAAWDSLFRKHRDADDDEITDAIEYLQDVADVPADSDSLTRPIKLLIREIFMNEGNPLIEDLSESLTGEHYKEVRRKFLIWRKQRNRATMSGETSENIWEEYVY
jgi:hypothetical protein